MGTPADLGVSILKSVLSADDEFPKERPTAPELPPVSNEVRIETIRLRKKLRFFFLNPIEKWQTKRRLPFKFAIQIIKIFLVTYQLCVFAQNRYSHINYATSNRIAFSRMFLKEWDGTREVTIYPPANGPLAIWQQQQLIDNVNFAVRKYAEVNTTLGFFSYHKQNHCPSPLHLCLEHYPKVDYSNEPEIDRECFSVREDEAAQFSFVPFLDKNNVVVNYQLLLAVTLEFSLISFSYRPGGARCGKFDITINFDNRNMDGLMEVSLLSNLKRHVCPHDPNFSKTIRAETTMHTLLNSAIIFFCTISLVLCSRAIIKAQILKARTMRYFRRVRKTELSLEGKFEFWNFWYVMIIVNDVLIIIGSYMELRISRNEYTTKEWSICSLCLGTGALMVWFGVLRYLGFFKNYNMNVERFVQREEANSNGRTTPENCDGLKIVAIVIMTIKRAFPEMMRFLLGTLIIYAGFIFCGWLVLGPFHIKFRSLSRTSETLFSLVNGDDMFATFTILETDSSLLWWYSRLYLYGFISLFIYAVLNLFLSVILDAYETIKEYYTNGFPKSDLQQFITESDGDEGGNDLIVAGGESGNDWWLWDALKSLVCPRFQVPYPRYEEQPQ